MTFKEFKDVINKINLPDDASIQVVVGGETIPESYFLPIELKNITVQVENVVLHSYGEITGEDLFRIQTIEDEEYLVWIFFDKQEIHDGRAPMGTDEKG